MQTLWDLIYPPVCIHCQRVGSLWCISCQQTIVSADDTLPSTHLDDYMVLGQHTGTLRAAIHALKYEHEERLCDILGALLTAKILECGGKNPDMIVPVPLYTSRLKERGYNQAESIAQALTLDRPILPDGLLRIRDTPSQVDMQGPEQRRANVRGAFVSQYDLSHLTVLLIDDVCTTGATLEACAIALRAAGAATVLAATVSRA